MRNNGEYNIQREQSNNSRINNSAKGEVDQLMTKSKRVSSSSAALNRMNLRFSDIVSF